MLKKLTLYVRDMLDWLDIIVEDITSTIKNSDPLYVTVLCIFIITYMVEFIGIILS